MAGTEYGYATNKEWTRHPILNGPCIIQVQYGDTALVHFGALPVGHDPLVYEGIKHQHFFQKDEPFKYTGNEEIWIRAFADNVSGIYQKAKVVCSPLVNV